MPLPRYIVLIVLFWLGTTAWLFNRDLWPRLRTGEPPPFSIDLADEAKANYAENRWLIFKGDEKEDKGYASTRVNYHAEDDTYELIGKYRIWTGTKRMGEAEQAIDSMYRVTRDGDLREITAKVTVNLFGLTVDGEITGKVENRMFRPRVEIKKPTVLHQELKPVEVSSRGSVLNPLQPLNRLPGIRRGQRWRVPLVDPLADLMRAQTLIQGLEGTAPTLPYVDAEVKQGQYEGLSWGPDKTTVPCLVIEYSGADLTGRTFVRASDFLIIQQEVARGGERLTLVREHP